MEMLTSALSSIRMQRVDLSNIRNYNSMGSILWCWWCLNNQVISLMHIWRNMNLIDPSPELTIPWKEGSWLGAGSHNQFETIADDASNGLNKIT